MQPSSRLSGALHAGLLAFVTAVLLAACGGGGGSGGGSTPTTPGEGSTVPVGDTVALTASGKLISFNRTAPGTLVGSIAVTGLAGSETLLGIDFRPVDGKLYAVGSLAHVYTVDPSTGVATLRSAMGPAIGDNKPFTRLDGARFAIGYNGVTDRLRVVSDTGQNLHLNVDNGSTVTDVPINGATAKIATLAHTNALPGAVRTRLYDIDSATGTLYLQEAPNDGTLSAPVPLGVSFTTADGFSIDARNNTAYAALVIAGATHLYAVPLAAGNAAIDLGTIGSGEALLGLALKQPLVVNVVALTADGLSMFLFDAAAPTVITATLPISGLDSGETVLGFDYRPADKQLYGLTSSARVVTLDTATGAATLVSSLAADPSDDTSPYDGLTGTKFSVDFDPARDRLRVVSDTGVNLLVDVATGSVVTGDPITGVTVNNVPLSMPVVAAVAHGNDYVGASGTTLYELVADPSNGYEILSTQSPPDGGTSTGYGNPPYALGPGAAMDIAGGDDGLVLVAAQIVPDTPWVLFTQQFRINADYLLYRNLDTNNYVASQIGGPDGPPIIDIAIQPL